MGIPDIVELYGLLPNGKPINTNPYLKDTDGDGIPDNEEIQFSLKNLTYNFQKDEYDGSLIAWSDPTSKTVNNQFGQIVYKGETYKIDVPAIRSRQNQYWYEPVYEIFDQFSPDSDIQLNLFDYINGKENSMSDDPEHDGTGKIDLYTFTKNGYLKDEFKTNKSFQAVTDAVGAICGIIELINGSISKNSISFTFYKTKNNNARKVVITASSTDVERMYTPFATNRPNSAFVNNSGNIMYQINISNAAREVYVKLTGKSYDTSYFYDILVTVDKRHANNGAFAQLWINNNGDVMAAPLLYSNDKVEIAKRSGLFYWLDYTPLIELKLSDSINLEQSFIDLLNTIYK